MAGVTYRDVEADLRAWFIAGGITRPISTKKRRGDKAPAWLEVVRIGGPTNTLVTEVPLVELSAYADTAVNALALINQARTLLHRTAITTDSPFFWSDEYGGPVNLPDPLLPEQARYTANWALWFRI